MRQLVEKDGVFAVLGNVGTPTAAVSVPYVTARKVVLVGALSGSPILRRSPPDRYVFSYRPSWAEETAAAVRLLVDGHRIAPDRIALVTQDDEFGASGRSGAVAELERRGVDPAGIVHVTCKANAADLADAVAALKRRSADLDAAVMVATYKPAASFIRAARDAGLRLLTTNVSPVDAASLAEDLVHAGRGYTDGVIVTQVVPLPTSRAAGAARFQEALARFGGGERSGVVAFEGWVVGHLLAEGLRRTGREVDSEKLVEALESIRDLDLGIGALVSFGPDDHQGSERVWGTILQPDGSWKQIDPS
jgi:ABC-type branched-subunit amino acid transport system substrate-binding protein